MGVVVDYPTLEHVAMEARPYPTHLLEGCETGLVLFAAAFMGHNDAIHMAEAGLKVECVDIDGERLERMRSLYPSEWAFYEADAWTYAEAAAREDLVWDVVSVDTFTGSAMLRSLASLHLWCSLARRAATVTITHEAIDAGHPLVVPEGWTWTLFERATDVYWLVLVRV